ncbi:MAG: DUF1822 family protein [Cyanobacteria bacterium J06638_22]
MTNPSLDYDEILGERFLQPDAIDLDEASITWAAATSQTANTEDPWALYLQLLAGVGVQQWLQERSPRLCHLPIENPIRSSLIQIGDTLTHLLPTPCLEDGSVEIPDRILETADLDVHLLVEVLEELAQVQVRGFLRHPELMQAIQTVALQPEDGSYTVPIDWFDLEPDRFLVQVEAWEPASVSEPLVLENLDRNPQRVAEALAGPAINAAVWFRDQLDQVAQELSWMLLPSFSYSAAMRSLRSPVEQLDGILSDLTRYRSVTIPTTARSAAYDFRVEDAALRLYVVTWELPSAGAAPDWNLLAILSPQSDALMPLGTRLQIRDAQTLLTETTLDDASGTFLYAQVIGEPNERFLISVRSPNGISVTLPPFVFLP